MGRSTSVVFGAASRRRAFVYAYFHRIILKHIARYVAFFANVAKLLEEKEEQKLLADRPANTLTSLHGDRPKQALNLPIMHVWGLYNRNVLYK